MPLKNPLSFDGLEADLDALCQTYKALASQQTALQNIISQHNVTAFLPINLVKDTREAAFSKSIDKSILETLLFVGIIASFQKFLKVLVSDVLTHLSQDHKRFSEIDEQVRESYLSAAASTYRYKKSGSVRGVRVNFHLVEQSLKECLTDSADFTLEGEAITSEMGNPSQSAIESVLSSLGHKSPFDNNFGSALRTRGWSEGVSDGDNTRKALQVLSKSIERRNDAAHGMKKIVFNPNEFLEVLDFFRIFAGSLFDQINNKY